MEAQANYGDKMFWLKAVSPNFIKRVTKANLTTRQIELLKREAGLNFVDDITPKYSSIIIRSINMITTYEFTLCAIAENEGYELADSRLDRVLLTLSLLRVAINLARKGIQKSSAKQKQQCVLAAQKLINVARKIAFVDLNSHPDFSLKFEHAVSSLKNYIAFIDQKQKTASPWTRDEWYLTVSNSETFILPGLCFYHLAAATNHEIPSSWFDDFRFNFASLFHSYDELYYWKKNTLERKPTFLWALVASKFSGQAKLTDIAKFIYLSSESLWLFVELQKTIDYIQENIPKEASIELTAMIKHSIAEAKKCSNRFSEIRISLENEKAGCSEEINSS